MHTLKYQVQIMQWKEYQVRVSQYHFTIVVIACYVYLKIAMNCSRRFHESWNGRKRIRVHYTYTIVFYLLSLILMRSSSFLDNPSLHADSMDGIRLLSVCSKVLQEL